SDDDDLDSTGDVEMGEFYSAGGSGGTVRERRQQPAAAADTQRLLSRGRGGSGSGLGGNADSRSLGSSPLHGHDSSNGLLLPGA
ncbi:unnamed protein product, partial [Ectocarpus fasciculatus]